MERLIIVRGGGDLATGTIYRLHQAGYHVLVLEVQQPLAIRRQVAFCQAIYDNEVEVEGVKACRIEKLAQCQQVFAAGKIPVYIDEQGEAIQLLKPEIVIDAILAKKNLGTNRQMAPLTIALGPGFEASKDVDAVIETKRGHHLGRIYYQGSAIKNTGIPGVIAGYGKERVMHAPVHGLFQPVRKIGDVVKKGEVLAHIQNEDGLHDVYASLDGVLRGILQPGLDIPQGLKIADIDPRLESANHCTTISDKARCISGSVLEVICRYEHLGGRL